MKTGCYPWFICHVFRCEDCSWLWRVLLFWAY